MNKYIDHLTINEYEQILAFMDMCEDKLKMQVSEGNSKPYIEYRFIKLKIKNIIKKYKKVW